MAILLTVVVPIIFSTFIYLYGDKSKPLRNTLVMIPSIINFLIIVSISKIILSGGKYSAAIVNIPPFSIQFNADHFSIYIGLLMSFLWMLTNIYSFGYMEHEHAQTRYFASLTFVLGATMGIIFSANFVSFFIFFEWLTFGVYPLVIHEESEEAWIAGVKYGAYLITGGAFVLLGIAAVYVMTGGNVSFTPGGIPEMTGQSKQMLIMVFLFFMFGFGFKAAIIPMHSWLPDAMIAPTPVSAVLHAVAVVNVGLTGFYRVIYNIYGIDLFKELGLNVVLGVPAAITIIVSAILGLRQKELKRMLAFSTVNQLSYVLLGISSGAMLGMLGGLLHIVYHSFMKITLFYCAGSIITQSGNKYISRMGGLAKRMPMTMLAFTIAAIGIIGLPPVCGWISKWYMVQSYIEIGKPIYAAVFILSGIIELGYLTPPIFLAYFGKEDKSLIEEAHAGHGGGHGHVIPLHERSGFWSEAPVTMTIPIIIVACGSILYGVWSFVPHFIGEMTLKALLGI